MEESGVSEQNGVGLSLEVSRLPPVLSPKTNALAGSASLFRLKSPVRVCVRVFVYARARARA